MPGWMVTVPAPDAAAVSIDKPRLSTCITTNADAPATRRSSVPRRLDARDRLATRAPTRGPQPLASVTLPPVSARRFRRRVSLRLQGVLILDRRGGATVVTRW